MIYEEPERGGKQFLRWNGQSKSAPLCWISQAVQTTGQIFGDSVRLDVA